MLSDTDSDYHLNCPRFLFLQLSHNAPVQTVVHDWRTEQPSVHWFHPAYGHAAFRQDLDKHEASLHLSLLYFVVEHVMKVQHLAHGSCVLAPYWTML